MALVVTNPPIDAQQSRLPLELVPSRDAVIKAETELLQVANQTPMGLLEEPEVPEEVQSAVILFREQEDFRTAFKSAMEDRNILNAFYQNEDIRRFLRSGRGTAAATVADMEVKVRQLIADLKELWRLLKGNFANVVHSIKDTGFRLGRKSGKKMKSLVLLVIHALKYYVACGQQQKSLKTTG